MINHIPVLSLDNAAPIAVFTGLRANNPLDPVCLIETPPGVSRMTPNKIKEITRQLIKNLHSLHKQVLDTMHPRLENQGVGINFDVGDFVLVAHLGQLRPLRPRHLSLPWCIAEARHRRSSTSDEDLKVPLLLLRSYVRATRHFSIRSLIRVVV